MIVCINWMSALLWEGAPDVGWIILTVGEEESRGPEMYLCLQSLHFHWKIYVGKNILHMGDTEC